MASELNSTAIRRDTVLVVDDTPDTLGFLTDTLDHAGFTVLIATDGSSALDLVEQGLAAGGVDYVTKPIVVDELLARIRVHLANARTAHGTSIALDATGRFLLATDRAGRLLWCTPKAKQLLAELYPAQRDGTASLSPTMVEHLLQLRQEGAGGQARTVLEAGARKLEISVLAPIGPDELLFRLNEVNSSADEAVLQESLQLTTRESEVLLWISRGKSNREIGEILSISPRTVNKHLEQVFVKLGVENRASAAARAVRALAR
jgi:DNA-binding CsgD family transcriptional regulator